MTTAVTNHTGTDITDFTVEQSSTYRTEIFMEQPLLDATKDYVVSCSEFAAPLSEEPMLTYRLAVRDLLPFVEGKSEHCQIMRKIRFFRNTDLCCN